jgi:hypothetical protein
LPTLARETLEKEMTTIGIVNTVDTEETLERKKQSATCTIRDDVLTIGSTSARVFRPTTNTKIPETLFYDTYQVLSSSVSVKFCIPELC